MKLVYVAGPYRAKTAWEIDCNIHRAKLVAAEVAKCGAMPVCPHTMTAHMDGLAEDRFWLDGTLELARRCDAIIMCDGWERSSGSCAEREEMLRLGKPVFFAWHDIDGCFSVPRLELWLGDES